MKKNNTPVHSAIRQFILTLSVIVANITVCAQENTAIETIRLNAPDKQRGESVMQALAKRQSTRTFSDKQLSLQDLSDLLWAANGINRPESGKRTAPSAMNKQDVKIYVCTEKGNYYYDAKSHTLLPISEGDVRPLKAPVCLILVTDTDDTWAALDAGIVSQNISIFCAGTGMATVPRGSMDKEQLRQALKLKDAQCLMLNHPVGYPL